MIQITSNLTVPSSLINDEVNYVIDNGDDKYRFSMKIPSVKNVYFDQRYAVTLLMLKLTPSQIEERFKLQMESNIDFLTVIFTTKNFSSIMEEITYSFELLGIKLTNKSYVFHINDVPVSHSILKTVIDDIIKLSSVDIPITEEKPLANNAQSTLEEKIKKMRAGGKTKNKTNEDSINFNDFILILIMELGLKQEDILHMNFKLFDFLLENYFTKFECDLTNRAYSGGMAKKPKILKSKEKK